MDPHLKSDIAPMTKEEVRILESNIKNREPQGKRKRTIPVEDDIETRQNNAIIIGAAGTEFLDNPNGIKDPLEYQITGTDPGLVVIFNHEKFQRNIPTRNGTYRDVEELIITLGRLMYNIDPEFIFHDLSRAEIKKKIKEICAMDLHNRNCLICIYLSHGSSENMLEARDGQIAVEEIYTDFCNCSDLMGKPKFFLFQACKTTESNASKQMDQVDCDKYTKKLVCSRTIKNDIPPDVLLLYSTIEGEVSFRHELYGTWFIQELCRNMTAYGRRDDVFSIVMRTTKCVAYSYCFVDTDGTKVKQLPIFISTLQHKFYLTRSKERLYLMQLMEQLSLLQEQVKALDNRVKDLKENV